MRRREFVLGLSGSVAGSLSGSVLPRLRWISHAALAPEASLAGRGLRICVSSKADAGVRNAAESLVGASARHPLMSIMADGNAPVMQVSEEMLAGPPTELAYHHLIIVGTVDDPLVRTVWQREARVDPGSMYVFGFGWLRGEIGYIESNRNPFLHGAAIASAPYETEIVTITGNSTAGVEMALRAFAEKQLVNGVVAAKGWTRLRPGLLDRDPLPPEFVLPSITPKEIGGMNLVAFTQAGEDEYRGVMEDTALMPVEICRAKYFSRGLWDGAGALTAIYAYQAGLHRRAYGNTLWMARFADASQAGAAAAKIAAAAKLTGSANAWQGPEAAYATGSYPGERAVPGQLTLQRQGAWVTMQAF